MSSIGRQKATVAFMIRYYCRKKHGGPELCDACGELTRYALARLDSCPHGERKPSCSRCAIHCYAPERRRAIKDVMRFVGPRMLYLAPLEFMRHLRGSGRSAAS